MTLRAAVIGLGMIGRHHARILQSLPGIEFAGAVDPEGDRFGAVHDPEHVHAAIGELLASDPPDLAVVAVPTEEHLDAVG
ncbi:MAG: UDP-N-acetylglucosamine 3-dehydrogenase, partial [Solirubrobacteraceae bacterium]|nr:UDP-N-acetylglucosamine 3-dehydrogenase [Solirubrobacteraceae bacterium]